MKNEFDVDPHVAAESFRYHQKIKFVLDTSTILPKKNSIMEILLIRDIKKMTRLNYDRAECLVISQWKNSNYILICQNIFPLLPKSLGKNPTLAPD